MQDVVVSGAGGRRRKEMPQSRICGWLFIGSGSVFFIGFLYATVVSKLLPPSDNPIISAIQNDRFWFLSSTVETYEMPTQFAYNRYYCFLVPLTLPVLVVAVYFHWLSMKMFKHA
ncbi:hypothetical protein ACLB2K_041782 [Fragaria x ananassa]